MKIFSSILAIVLLLTLSFSSGCKGNRGSEGNNGTESESGSPADTGFTGIKKYKSGGHIVMETNFNNGLKDGLSTTYYINGKVKGTTWYRNDLREDTSKWYYQEGQLFRSTPFRKDTIDGTQIQYYRNGKLKAKIGYRKGARTFDFSEYDMNGRVYTGYPELVIQKKDDYASSGTYSITLSLSDKSTKVRYYRGEFGNGTFDSTKCERIKSDNGIGTLDLKKTGTPQEGYVDVLASILSPYGNNYLVHKKIDLPYKDLK